jgi:hypothetical protein
MMMMMVIIITIYKEEMNSDMDEQKEIERRAILNDENTNDHKY